MAKVIVFISGTVLLIASAVFAVRTHEFVAKAHEIEGRVFAAASGRRATRKDIEFWIKHSEYRDPFADLGPSPDEVLERSIKEMEKLTGRPSRISPSQTPKPGPTPAIPEIVKRVSTYTRYTFVTFNLLPGLDHDKVPVLYDPESLSKNLTRAPGETLELDSNQAMVNAFTSLYAYSLLTGVPGGLLFSGSILAFLKSRFGGIRYYAQYRTSRADAQGWVRCPGCKLRFNTKDPHRWNHERHVSCGQRIRL